MGRGDQHRKKTVTRGGGRHSHPEPAWPVARVWTAEHQLRAGCCGRPRQRGSGLPGSACKSPWCPQGCGISSAGPAPGSQQGRAVTPVVPVSCPLLMYPSQLPVVPITWNTVYMMQLSERPPAYSDTQKMFRPHLLKFSSSWQ